MIDTYRICLSRGKEKKVLLDVPCTEEYIKAIVNGSFRGRFSKPDGLRVSDGIKLIVINKGMRSVVMARRIYNKSMRQVMTTIKKAINDTPLIYG